MKKAILLITAIILGTAVQAHTIENVTQTITKHGKHVYTKQPFTFMVEGIRYKVFPNGTMDFKIPNTRKQTNNWNNRRYNAPGYYKPNHTWNRPSIRYDYYGRINKIGYTSITYNRYDQVRRIGTVFIQYNRNGQVSKIGGMNIFYNRYGNVINTTGTIYRSGCGYCGMNACSMKHPAPYNYQKNNGLVAHHHYPNRKRQKGNTKK